MRSTWIASIAALALGGACGGSEEPLPAAAPETPLLAVFEAVADGDCARFEDSLSAELVEEIEETGCEAGLASLRGQFELEWILEVRVDGRDPRARLIRADVVLAGKRREKTYKVEARGGRWVLVTL